MWQWLTTLGAGTLAFVSTNVDDLFILAGLFASRRWPVASIVAGQYLGLATLFAGCVLASLFALLLPRPWVGLLGLLPLLLGVHGLWQTWRAAADDDDDADRGTPAVGAAYWAVLAVAGITVANGGDNIGIYIPLFAALPGWKIALIALVFAVGTAVWCLLAWWLVRRPWLQAPLRRWGDWLTPVVLLVLGLFILIEAGSYQLIF